jgi:branched-chain amino acid transport system permease protein
MDFSGQLLADAIISGVLLGAFYAGMAIGVSIAFGMLDVVNIAHPAFIVLSSFLVFWLNPLFGLDPLVGGLLLTAPFFLLGCGVYTIYHYSFERRGQDSLRGLTFFFGLMFIVEILLVLTFGVDLRSVQVSYATGILVLGDTVIPYRLLVPAAVSTLMIGIIHLSLTRTFFGRAVLAGAQDQLALRLMGVNPTRIRQIAFGLSFVTAAIAGASLIMMQPITPPTGQEFIGRVFAICVLGGLGSVTGTVLGALILGLAESIMGTFFGPSWAPAVSFGILLAALAIRPAGLMGR